MAKIFHPISVVEDHSRPDRIRSRSEDANIGPMILCPVPVSRRVRYWAGPWGGGGAGIFGVILLLVVEEEQ